MNLVSQCLRENPPRARPGMPTPGSFPRPMGSMAMLFPVPPGLTGVIQSTSGFLFSFNGLVEAQYRLLVSDNKVGCVIGKGGDVNTLFTNRLYILFLLLGDSSDSGRDKSSSDCFQSNRRLRGEDCDVSFDG